MRSRSTRSTSRWTGSSGRIDVLGNVAGEGGHGDPAELTPAEIQESLQNLLIGRLHGTQHSTQHSGRRMIAAGKGSIMSIVAIAGCTALGRHEIPHPGMPPLGPS